MRLFVAVPLPPASAPTIAGTSFWDDSTAVNVGFVAVGAVGVSFEHPAASRLTATASADQRFIGFSLRK